MNSIALFPKFLQQIVEDLLSKFENKACILPGIKFLFFIEHFLKYSFQKLLSELGSPVLFWVFH
jgi:hypothetical protein